MKLDASRIEPMISYGTNPGMVAPIGGRIPERGDEAFDKSLRYMGFAPGEALPGKPVNVVFIGSCTNSRLSDLRAAAGLLRGRRIARGVRMLVVPGSQQVKRAAEAEGLARDIHRRGRRVARIGLLDVHRHEWRHRGCGPLRRQHEQPELRRPPGPGCAHLARESGDGGRRRRHRPAHRSTRVDGMNPIRLIRSRTVVLPATDVDTDQIIPARFLTTTDREGLGRRSSPTGDSMRRAVRGPSSR